MYLLQPCPLPPSSPPHPSLSKERDNLLVEISALQQSSSKLNEDTIFDLKQRIEDLHMDKDALAAQVKNLRREVTMLK